MEAWKKYTSEIYVSSCGDVRVNGVRPNIRPNSTKKPYLCFSYKYKRYLVHRLVAECFCRNHRPKEYDQVNHIDGDKQNNNYDNLEWVNNKLNILHAVRLGLHGSTPGESNYFATLTEDKVKAIIRISATTKFLNKEAANYFGIPYSTYRKIKDGTHWELSAYRNLFEQ